MLPPADCKEEVMKKLFTIILAAALLLPAIALAEDNSIETFVIQRNDYVVPRDGDPYFSHGIFAWWHTYGWLGLGIDVTVKPKQDFLEANPFVTVNKGPWYLNVGTVTNSDGSDYVHYGIWYFNRHLDNKVEIFLDLRNFSGIGGETSDYLDAFLQTEYDITKNLSIGAVADYCRYWEESQDYWAYGPIAYYKISDVTKVFGRWTHDTDGTNKYRAGFEFFWK
jgi:hypothetical protein